MKRMLATVATLLFASCSPVMAQDMNPSGAPLYAKPVPCGDLPGLIKEFEKSDMYPLMGLGGFSWMDDGTTQPSVTIVVVDADGRFAVVEKNIQMYCLLATGNVVEYNSDKLKELMDWK